MTRALRSLLFAGVVAAGAFLSAVPAQAAVYYIGAFTGSAPSNTTSCGTRATPCATLAYWTQNRRSVLVSGDTVRLAPGMYTGTGSNYHCIIPTADVTYEGRTADDAVLDDYTSVVINSQGMGTSSPCDGQWISCRNGCNYNNLTIRDMKFQYSPGTTPTDAWFLPSGCPGGVCNGPVIDRVWFHGGRAQRGVDIGVNSSCPISTDCTRAARNLVITDSQFDNFPGGGGGAALYLGLVDGFTLTNTTVHHNGANWCNDTAVSASCDGSNACNPDCDDGDGIAYHGAINGTITGVGTWNNRQYGHDFTRTGESGDDCDSATRYIVVDGSYSFNAGIANYSFSGCAAHITVRNSFAWGLGQGFHLYFSSCGIHAYNNTIWTNRAAFWAYSMHSDIDLRNNIFIANNETPVSVTDSITGSTAQGIWDGNIVVSPGGTTALIVRPSDTTCAGFAGATGCQADPDYSCPPSGTKRGTNATYADSAAGLTAWRSANYMPSAGSTAQRDFSWGSAPSFINAAVPNAPNLHLQASDSVAIDHGATLEGFATDYDGGTRPSGATWDVGADESGTQSTQVPPAPVLLQAQPIM